MSNNSLISVNESIFTKIKNFFKKLFGYQDVENYKINNFENNQEIKDSIFDESIKVKETEEQKLLRLQNLIREKRISENDLSDEEKEKLRNLYNSQINNLKASIIQKRIKIMKIKYEQKRKSRSTL